MKVPCILCFLILLSLVACNEKKSEVDSDLLLALAALQPPDRVENYDRDVQIITHTPYIQTSGGASVVCDLDYSDRDLNYMVEKLKAEIARYPRGYWIKAGVEKVVLCSNVTLNGRFVGGFSNVDRIVYLVSSGIADRGDSMIVCGGIPNFNAFECYAGVGINHELTHSVDRKMLGIYFFDPDWEKLNDPGFRYGDTPQSGDWHPTPGFILPYGMTNPIEDRATFGGVIMGGRSTYNLLVQFCQTDPIVAAKTRKIIDRWKQFWPFPGAENTEWKIRMTQVEQDCRLR
ncbi:putative lipoprotein [Leptospira weilii serovar Topaz str. LT2116]|uniref:Putative lipoprotein n=1 Tax=Leptospira weilii serovar Topaz str. LT2116 TaxID=1088540 RepID=M3EIW8_9LEPT|nr:putative lipoprotein [Leptospira weilii serovar Topaz str. LT2116]